MRKYNELNYTQISTGSYLRSIGGPTHRWRGQERRFASLWYETNRFQVAVGLFCNRSQKPSKDEVYSFLLRWSNFGCGSRCFICVLRVFRWKGRLTEYAMPGLQLFCSHHILLHLFIYYWTDQQHLGLYLPVKFDLVIMYKEYSM